MLHKENRKKKIENRIVKINLFYILLPFFYSLQSAAQCAMCRASLESSGNKSKVEAVNDGIVFLMAIPYILVAIIGFVIYRMYTVKKPNQE